MGSVVVFAEYMFILFDVTTNCWWRHNDQTTVMQAHESDTRKIYFIHSDIRDRSSKIYFGDPMKQSVTF